VRRGECYSEHQVNELLKRDHEGTTILRRERIVESHMALNPLALSSGDRLRIFSSKHSV
jgi:hypothetical protein